MSHGMVMLVDLCQAYLLVNLVEFLIHAPTPRGPIKITGGFQKQEVLQDKEIFNEATQKTDRMFNLGQKFRAAGIASVPYGLTALGNSSSFCSNCRTCLYEQT
jgi:hypothetical protein